MPKVSIDGKGQDSYNHGTIVGRAPLMLPNVRDLGAVCTIQSIKGKIVTNGLQTYGVVYESAEDPRFTKNVQTLYAHKEEDSAEDHDFTAEKLNIRGRYIRVRATSGMRVNLSCFTGQIDILGSRKRFPWNIVIPAIVLILLIIAALLCIFGIVCPIVRCPEGTNPCNLCPEGCCLPDGTCPCPAGTNLCPPELNCSSKCCKGEECLLGMRSLFETGQFWIAPPGAATCPPGIDCPTGICSGNCCLSECRPDAAATCNSSINANATGGCTSDGSTCIYKCGRPECMGCCDEFGNCIGAGSTCMPLNEGCASNSSCCSGTCNESRCACIPSGGSCNASAQCCTLACDIGAGSLEGKCAYDCGSIDCTKCKGGSCGGTGQKSCTSDLQCAGGSCSASGGCISCPSGSHWVDAKRCCVFDSMPDACIPSAPEGMEYDVDKGMNCVTGDPSKCCPIGTVYNADKNSCCLVTDPTKCCPLGTKWDETKNCCVGADGRCICGTLECTRCKEGSCGGTGQVECTSDENCAGIRCTSGGCGWDCGGIDCAECKDGSCGGTGSVACTAETESTACAGLKCDPASGCRPVVECGTIRCNKCDTDKGLCGGTGSAQCTTDKECECAQCDSNNGCMLKQGCDTIPRGDCTTKDIRDGQPCDEESCCAQGLFCSKIEGSSKGICCIGGGWLCYTSCSADNLCITGTCVDGLCK